MALTQISTGGVKNDAVTAGKIPADAVGQSEIADEAVDEARLQISNAGTNGQFLSKQSGNTGGLTWATVDSTPEGTVIKSTGESGTSKFLRVDGDGSCSWQVPPDTNTQLTLHDEDNFASNSATAAASQQSIKAYVDTQVGSISTAPEVTATANGAIAANTAVVVRSDGDVEEIEETLNINTTLGSTGRVYAGNTVDVAFCYDESNSRWMCAYSDVYSTSGYPYYTYTNAGEGWTNNHTQVYAGQADQVDIVYDPAQEAVLLYFTVTSGSNRGRARVLYSKNSSSMGSISEFYEQARPMGWVKDPASGRLIGHLQRRQSTPYLAVLAQLSIANDNSITDHGEITASTDLADYGDITVGGGFLLYCQQKEDGKIHLRAAKWNGSSYTQSTSVQATTFNSDYNVVSYNENDGKFALVAQDTDSSDALKGAIITVTESGGTPSISVGTFSSSNNPAGSRQHLYYDSAIKQLVCAYKGSDNKPYVRRCTVDGSNFAWNSSSTNLNSGTVGNCGYLKLPVGYGNGKANVAWHDNNQTKSRTVALGTTDTNLTTGNFIGFSNGNATADDGTCTVNVTGNTTTQSSLTPGQKYYVTGNGSLSTTAGTPSVEAGTALSSTKLLIKG